MIVTNIPFVSVYKGNRVIETVCSVSLVDMIAAGVKPVASPPHSDLEYEYVVLDGGTFYVVPGERVGEFNVTDPVPADKIA